MGIGSPQLAGLWYLHTFGWSYFSGSPRQILLLPSPLHSPNVFPVCALEEGVVHDFLQHLPNHVLCIEKEVVDKVVCLRGVRREFWWEEDVFSPIHKLVMHLCRQMSGEHGRYRRGEGCGGKEGVKVERLDCRWGHEGQWTYTRVCTRVQFNGAWPTISLV